jgi:hypothetical protein
VNAENGALQKCDTFSIKIFPKHGRVIDDLKTVSVGDRLDFGRIGSIAVYMHWQDCRGFPCDQLFDLSGSMV